MKERGQTMARWRLFRTASLIAMMAVAGFGAAGQVTANEPVIQVVGSDATSRFVPLGIGKSVVIELPRDAKDVLVADPKIANAIVRTARRAYIIGSTIGQTNVYFFDAEGKQIAGFDIAVSRDLNGIREALKQSLPGANIQIQGVGEGVVLTGNVWTPLEAQTAVDIASRLTDDPKKIVNGIVVHGNDQVMLKVTVAEVQRDVIKQLGIDLNASVGIGTGVIDFSNTNPFSVNGAALVPANALKGTFPGFNATLRALERAGIIRTLAEPNLSAVSGESASFLAGGEFPVPAGFTCDQTTRNCQYQVQWKKFGVGLNFTPVVLSEGRISLKVMTEVSELSTDNQLTLVQSLGLGSSSTLTIPSVKTRRAETTVEIPSGGALALAGMIQEQTKQQINGMPGLMQLPVLGTLFKSRDYVNRQTELMVLVMPYTVRAVARKELSRPDDGFADASDPSSILLGKFNRIYGVAGKVEPNRAYHGNYGFIID
jgi:pilus assembly protein CpaC